MTPTPKSTTSKSKPRPRFQVLLRSNGYILPGLVLENPCATKAGARGAAELLLKRFHREYDQALICAVNEQGQPIDLELTVLTAETIVRTLQEPGD